MANRAGELPVVCGARDPYPQAFWWQGRSYRVAGLQSLRVVGSERRYRLATAEGCFELVQSAAGGWRLRHAPGWLERALVRFQNGPRYPLPVWRRRRYRRPAGVRPCGPAAQARLARPGGQRVLGMPSVERVGEVR